MKKMLKLSVLILVVVSGIKITYSANCGNNNGKNNGYFGETNVGDYNDGVDPDEGQSVFLLADDNEYHFKCCGRIDTWTFRAGNTGDIYFQVWRNTGTTWELVGQNYNNDAVTLGQVYTYDVPDNEEIIVNNGDIIGWYSPSKSVISYESGGSEDASDDWYSTTSLALGTTTFDWTTSGTHSDSRDYAIRADMKAPNNPNFDNLDNTLTLTNTDSLSFTVTATDADTSETLTMSMTAKTGFSFNAATGVLTNTVTMTAGTYVFDFQVQDTCGNTDNGQLTLTVTNVPPVINNLPSSAEVREDQKSEKHLYDIDVTDASGDTVTCSIPSVSPSSNDFIVRVKTGTTTNAIYVRANPTFNYRTQRKYDLTVSCTDGTTAVTGIFTVFISPNEAPVITNLAASTQVSTASTTAGDDVFTVTSTDAEGDQLHYNMTCSPPGCPFVIFDSGLVEASTDLLGHANAGYDLYIYVYDGYTLVGPRTLTISLTDHNSPPVLANLPLGSALSVRENTAVGTPVFQPIVTDSNLADTHTFTVSYNPASGASIFDASLSTGLISVAADINYESLASKTYTLSISVTDGKDSDTETLQISVIDVNEAPAFEHQQYFLTGNEGNAGDVVGTPTFFVTDPDVGATRSYSIDCADFNMDPASGQISLAVDYDLDIAGNSDSVNCTVTVSDGELTDTTTLTIILQNINDNLPTFLFSSYALYGQSSDSVGVVIGSVTATDGDLGSYGELAYNLDQSSLSNEFFGVQETGAIFIKNDLTTYYNRTYLEFLITATDGGGQVATSTVTVIYQGYSTYAPVESKERYITFFEDTRNLPWFVTLICLMCVVMLIATVQLVRSGCCGLYQRLDQYFARRNQLKEWKRRQMRQRKSQPRREPPREPPRQQPREVEAPGPSITTSSQHQIWDPWSGSANMLQ